MYLRIDRPQSTTGDAAEGTLATSLASTAASITYAAGAPPHGHENARNGVSFETPPMTEDLEVTGPLVLNVWIESTSEDADIYATLRNIGPDGREVQEIGPQGPPTVLTKGWLRASHRKLDKEKTLPYRPYHSHDERWWLKPNEPVECQVEIWATSIVLQKGHRLRVDVQSQDGVGTGVYTHFSNDYKAHAQNSIHAGGAKESYLLVPIIPAK
jgi:predicted acyl esterase